MAPPYQGRPARPVGAGAPLAQPDLSDRLGLKHTKYAPGPHRHSYDPKPYAAGSKPPQRDDARRPPPPAAHRESTAGNLLARLDGNDAASTKFKRTEPTAKAATKPLAPLAARIDGTHATSSNGGKSQSLARQTTEDSRWTKKGFQPATPVGGKPGSSSTAKQQSKHDHSNDLSSRIEPKEPRGRSRRSPVAPGPSRLSLEDRIGSTAVDHIDLTRDASSPAAPSNHSRASSRGSRGNTPVPTRTAPSLLQRLNGPSAQANAARQESASRQSSITSDMSLSTSDVAASSPPRPIPPPDMDRSNPPGEGGLGPSGTAATADGRPNSGQQQGPAFLGHREALRPDRHTSHSATRPTPAQLAASSAIGQSQDPNSVTLPAALPGPPPPPAEPADKEPAAPSGRAALAAALRSSTALRSPPRAPRAQRETGVRSESAAAGSAPGERQPFDRRQPSPARGAAGGAARHATERCNSSSERHGSLTGPREPSAALAPAVSQESSAAPASTRSRPAEAGTPPLLSAPELPAQQTSPVEAGTPPLDSRTETSDSIATSRVPARVNGEATGPSIRDDAADSVASDRHAILAVKVEPRSPVADRSPAGRAGETAGADVKPIVGEGGPSRAERDRVPQGNTDTSSEEQRKLEAAQQELDSLRRQEALLERLRKAREASARAKEHAENLRNVEAAEKAETARRLRESLEREKSQLEDAQRAQLETARPAQDTAASAVATCGAPGDSAATPTVESSIPAIPRSGQDTRASTTENQTSARDVPPPHPSAAHNWTRYSHQPVLEAVVRQRDAIFALQRQCDHAGLQNASRVAVARQLAKSSRGSQQTQVSELGNRLRDYASFCSGAGVPHFPISDAMLVLYAAAASPLDLGEKKRKQFVSSLRSLAKTIEPLWQRDGAYQQLRDLPNTSLALAAWKALGNSRNARNAYSNNPAPPPSDIDEFAQPSQQTQPSFDGNASLVDPSSTANVQHGPIAPGAAHSEEFGIATAAAETTKVPSRKRQNSAPIGEIPLSKQPRIEVAGFAQDGNTTAESDVERDTPARGIPMLDVKPGVATNSSLRVPGPKTTRSSLFRRLSPCPVETDRTSSRLHSVAAFFASFDPSLEAIAEPLVAAGFDSIADLARFAQLEVDSRLALLEQLHSADDCLMIDADAWSRFEDALIAVKARRWV